MASGESRRRRNSRGAMSFFEWLAPGSPRQRDSRAPSRSHQRTSYQTSSRKAGKPESKPTYGTASRAAPEVTRSKPPAEKPPKVQVDLKALDDRYLDIKFVVKAGFSVFGLIPFIESRYEDRGHSTAGTRFFEFYSSKGQRLSEGDRITSETRTLWYRVAKSQRDFETWKFSRWGDKIDGPVEGALSSEMTNAINAGDTVGLMRIKIARHMGISDENRIILIARDGLRRGSLQGNDWKIQEVKTGWLCRWLSVDVSPVNRYVILRGLGRQYVYHPHRDCVTKDSTVLLDYMDSRLFRGVHRHGFGESSTPREHATLILGDRRLSNPETLQWAATYDFEVSLDLADTFSLEESWLLPATDECIVCTEDKTAGEMAIKTTSSCQHRSKVCRDCQKMWLEKEVQEGRWAKLKCFECLESLEYCDVKRNASKETFDRYDNFMLRNVLNDLEEFRFCLSPTCNSGQIHPPECPNFVCIACRAQHCVEHNLRHEGETCEEYDLRNPGRQQDEMVTEEMKQSTSNTCPKCNKVVHKFDGCNHITCTCRHEWCYICREPHVRTEHGFTYCRHTPNCTETDNFANLFDDRGVFIGNDWEHLGGARRRRGAAPPREVEEPPFAQFIARPPLQAQEVRHEPLPPPAPGAFVPQRLHVTPRRRAPTNPAPPPRQNMPGLWPGADADMAAMAPATPDETGGGMPDMRRLHLGRHGTRGDMDGDMRALMMRGQLRGVPRQRQRQMQMPPAGGPGAAALPLPEERTWFDMDRVVAGGGDMDGGRMRGDGW